MFEQLHMPQHIKDALSKAIADKKISHAYLFHGGDEQTIEKAAREFAAACICTGKNAPCGVCSHCQKAFEQSHADIIALRSVEGSIKINHIRQMQYEISLMPYEADKKIYIVYKAETMQKPAQNSLLKLLEEPNDYAIIILLAQSKNNFYPTVLSRCQIYDFGAGAMDESTIELTVSFLKSMLQNNMQDHLAKASDLAALEPAKAAECMAAFLRDVLLYQLQEGQNKTLLVNGQYERLIGALAQKYQGAQIQRTLDFIFDRRLTASTNSQLFMQAIYCLLKSR